MKGEGPLYDELHERFEQAVEPQPVHRFLASLPPLLREHGAPHQLVVSTRYDLALERAFEEAGEEVDVVTYVAAGRYRGKFWHRPPGEEPRPIDVPNTYATELSLERRTVLLKLHGAVDLLPEREWESFVITEDDYFDYLGRSDVAARCRSRSRATAPQPLPLHRLRDGRLEPAPRHAPALGRPACRLPLVGDRPRADAARARVLAPLRRRRRRRRAERLRRPALAAARALGMTPSSPYRGLAPFEDSELDALFFFGREHDSEIVVANLIASRFTVLYGPSGVGKSSLLLASVARTLRELPEQPLVVVFSELDGGSRARAGGGRRRREGAARGRRSGRGGARRLPDPRPGRGVLRLPRRGHAVRGGARRARDAAAAGERPALAAGGHARSPRPPRRR